MIAFCRIDSRLVHGQVVEAWIPRLQIDRLIVVDDAAAIDDLTKLAFSMAMPAGVELRVTSVAAFDPRAVAQDASRSLVLFRDVGSAERSLSSGLTIDTLNLGNIHSGPGRFEIGRTIFVNAADADALNRIRRLGIELSIQPTPNEARLTIGAPLTVPASNAKG